MRVGERSRAALLLSNETTLRLDQNTTLTVPPPDRSAASLLDVLTGAINVISRTPRPFRVQTPYVNASIEGTEFLVGVGADSARVAVFEGRVVADNAQGSVTLQAGEQAVAGKGSVPVKELIVRPADAVQWALYFPTIFNYATRGAVPRETWGPALRESIDLYRSGQIAEAIAGLRDSPDTENSPRLLSFRAGLLLQIGRLDEAEPDLERALTLDPRHSDALSLRALIAIINNDRRNAMKDAESAVGADPSSPAARLALSYVQQSLFRIDQALSSVEKAAELDPNNALVWARVAELDMSTGDLEGSLVAARRAVELNPELAKTQMVLGFSYLTRFDARSASQFFQNAIRLNSADPLARLGLGLSLIHQGDLEGGREQIEIAVSLDPGSSLIRSYVGKAYYEEKRDKLAESQLQLAKGFDASDPTSYFYDALRKQSNNQPVDAMLDIQKSIEENDNRAVYRSRLLLDEDLAVRQASLARIFRDLGFDQLSLVEAFKSIESDPGDYSAHRFLADSYFTLPRREIARVSELLQSQLRQPLSVSPLEPQLGDGQSFILNGIGPARPGFSEFGSLFNRNQSALQLSGVVGGTRTFGDQVVASKVADSLAFSVGQFHFASDGFRPNDDLTKDILNAFVQSEISGHGGIQAEARHSETASGDLALRFDPNNFVPTSRTHAVDDSLRFGGHYVFSPDFDVIASPIFQDVRTSFNFGDPTFPFVVDERDRSAAFEFQTLYRSSHFSLTSGAGHYQIARRVLINGADASGHGSDLNVYSYGRLRLPSSDATIDLGLSYDRLRDIEVSRGQMNPKIGLLWSPTLWTTVRLGRFRVVKRAFNAEQTLEPTQVAGFNQFFDDLDGTVATRFGAALDQKITNSVFGGVEYSGRKLQRIPFIGVGEFVWYEREKSAYLYWTPSRAIAVSVTYSFEHFERPIDFTGDEQIVDVKTQRVPISVSVFSRTGLSARLVASYIRQEGQFLDASQNLFSGDERFWLVDAAASYRLPRRLGLVALEGRNLFDRQFRFQETDRVMPSVARRRLVFAKWSLAL